MLVPDYLRQQNGFFSATFLSFPGVTCPLSPTELLMGSCRSECSGLFLEELQDDFLERRLNKGLPDANKWLNPRISRLRNVHFCSLRGEHCWTHRSLAGRTQILRRRLVHLLTQHRDLCEHSPDHLPHTGYIPPWDSWHFLPCFGESGNQGTITITCAILGGPLPTCSKGSGPWYAASRLHTILRVQVPLLHSSAFPPWKALSSAKIIHRHISTFAVQTQRGFPEQRFPAWRISQLSPRHSQFLVTNAKSKSLNQMCWQNWNLSNCRVRSKPCQAQGKMSSSHPHHHPSR